MSTQPVSNSAPAIAQYPQASSAATPTNGLGTQPQSVEAVMTSFQSLLDQLSSLSNSLAPAQTSQPAPTTNFTGTQNDESIDGPTWLATVNNAPVMSDPRSVTSSELLINYFSQPRANESTVPETLQGFTYGSKPVSDPSIVTTGITNVSIAAVIGGPPEALELKKAGVGNLLNPEWKAVVSQAVEQNGGLGDSENGFLAFSKESGFVRLRNPGFTPEQNRRLAEMSLFGGWAIEDLPASKGYTTFTNAKENKAIENIIERFDVGIEKFKQDPSKGMTVNDGRRRFVMKLDSESGRVVSYNYKKASGLRGFVQRSMKFLAPVLDIASIALAPTGIGSIITQGVKMGLGWLATGKAKLGELVQFGASMIPGIGSITSAIGTTASNALSLAGKYVGQKID